MQNSIERLFAGLAHAETPFLDGLAARGVRYDRCWSPSGWTLPACASIVTGLPPSGHGLIHHDRRFDRSGQAQGLWRRCGGDAELRSQPAARDASQF